jgi:hypothetical protein
VCDRYIHVIYKISGCNSTSFGVVLSDMLHVVLNWKSQVIIMPGIIIHYYDNILSLTIHKLKSCV